jgi:hypothetical protein
MVEIGDAGHIGVTEKKDLLFPWEFYYWMPKVRQTRHM